jgi:hypothetical protein
MGKRIAEAAKELLVLPRGACLRCPSAGFGSGFANAAPVPPLAFFQGQARIACLGYGRMEDVEHAWILALAGPTAEFSIEFGGLTPGEFGDRVNAHHLEISTHLFTD